MLTTTAEEKFDWDQLVEIPVADETWKEGSQVLNFYPCDKDYRKNKDASAFVEKYCKNAQPLNIDAEMLKYASDHVAIKGAYLEMGVCTGRTINFIAALNPNKKIFGFDSFEGLPEAWVRQDIFIPKGTFQIKSKDWIPPVLHNVVLVKGIFRNTLPEFKEKILKDQPIAFLHIDCDIYSSTKDVFDILGDRIVAGTVIVFDEFYNYPGAEAHEFKAFQEFLSHTGKKASFLAFNQCFEQVAVQIIEE